MIRSVNPFQNLSLRCWESTSKVSSQTGLAGLSISVLVMLGALGKPGRPMGGDPWGFPRFNGFKKSAQIEPAEKQWMLFCSLNVDRSFFLTLETSNLQKSWCIDELDWILTWRAEWHPSYRNDWKERDPTIILVIPKQYMSSSMLSWKTYIHEVVACRHIIKQQRSQFYEFVWT